jgi:hypothetical protein
MDGTLQDLDSKRPNIGGKTFGRRFQYSDTQQQPVKFDSLGRAAEL